LRQEPEHPLHKSYIEWAAKSFNLAEASPMLVINNYVRDWGHVFIYDANSLQRLLEASGFVDVQPCKLAISTDPFLAGLEFVDRMPQGYLELESLVLEARKP
jgi:hypothetical protein